MQRGVSRFLPQFAVPFFLSLGATALCYFAAGPTLGLFFGTFFFTAMIVPPLQQATIAPIAIFLGVCAGLRWSGSRPRPSRMCILLIVSNRCWFWRRGVWRCSAPANYCGPSG